MDEFISKDDLKTFERWLKYQGEDAASLTAEALANWQHIFEDLQRQRAARPKVGLMDLRPIPSEYKYAVAACRSARRSVLAVRQAGHRHRDRLPLSPLRGDWRS